MELRDDYIQMLKRGWPAVILIAAAVVGVALGYLAVAPKTYQAHAVLFVSARGIDTVNDLQQGSQFSSAAVTTYAEIIESPEVLSPVSKGLEPRLSVDELSTMVSATARAETTLIDIYVVSGSPRQAAIVANAVADSAVSNIPALEVGSGDPPGQSLVRLQQIQSAVPSTTPLSPNTKQVLTVGVALGLALGLALTVVVQALDTRIRHAREVWSLTETPVIGAIPQLPRAQRNSLIVRDAPVSAGGEAYRTLRTNITFLEAKDRRSLLVTSASRHGADGQVATNLAWAMADAGRRVLLIDVDLRHPRIGDPLRLGADDGLSEVLAGHRALGGAVITLKLQNRLDVLLAGTLPPNPSELLGSPEMYNLLRQAEQDYDYIVLHAPSLLSYTDAAVVAGIARHTVVTVAAGKTHTGELSEALTALANVGVRPMGLVLTRLRTSELGREKFIRPPAGRNRLNRARTRPAPSRARSSDRSQT